MSHTRTTNLDEMSTSYGFQDVAENEKQSLVDEVFHRVAGRYDIMNDIMSAGMHRIWKNALVSSLAPPKSGTIGWQSVDVAGGTGDIAFRIIEASNRYAHTIVLDINSSMLDAGRERAVKNGFENNLTFIEANAEELPLQDGVFDACTIAFGIRNVPKIDKALKEAFRVLKPGGRFLCLEFSDVDIPIIDRFYEQWSFNAIPKIGKFIVGDDEPYRYLVESVSRFPNQQSFASMIKKAGFEHVTWRNFSGGIAALHSGWKI